ncbi:MAG TPA: hypothetical protein VEW92_09245 [Nitrososphaeraceae archaeon]|nr:hypothetical protein [Nitrososphaeraceae archaeon]
MSIYEYKVLLTYSHFKKVLTVVSFYQQPGDAKKAYLAQYSGVVSDVAPVKASYTTMKTNILIKNRLNPLNSNFKILLIEFFLPIADYIANR